jgi:CelD/BcsL family acetyltransferase involved in cellulose biosynthesis
VIEIVPSFEALSALRDEWSALWRRCPDAMPFQAPAWLLPWGRHFAPDRTRAVAVRERGDLIALVPVFEWQGALLLAGTGPSDYADGLFAPGHEALAAPVLAALAELADELECSCVDLQQIRPASPLLKAAPPASWNSRLSDGEVCPVMLLRGQDGLDCTSRRWRRNLSYARRRLAGVEGYALEIVPADLVAQTATELEELHAARWRQRGESGVLRDPLMSRLVRDALLELGADGLLRLHRLRLRGRTAAVALAIKGADAVCFYLSGFDPQWSRFGPGMAAIGCAIMHAAAEGAHEFHFLRGREAYKYHWGARDRRTFRRVLAKGAAPCA